MLTRSIFLIFIVICSILAGCETLKESDPIIAQKEYEKLIVGRFDADYVGNNNCLSMCHFHDKIRKDFEASTMGAQMSPDTGMPLVDCESCHGPGSLAIEGITDEKVAEDAKEGKQTACDYKTLIDLMDLPAPALSLICLKCHTANATFNLHNWNAGTHAVNEVSCSDCHKIHAGPDLIVRPKDTADMCYECHEEIKAEYALPTHHPVPEKKLICTDCHETHGTASDGLLRKNTVKATCAQCHAEKEGPFAFEHGDLNEDCTTCHSPHGSVNNYLLLEKEPFLCLECHDGHAADSGAAAESAKAFYTRCTDCHSRIHGTDVPSVEGKGRMTQ